MARTTDFRLRGCAAVGVSLLAVAPVRATPDFVEHVPTDQVHGEVSGITMRDPDIPREDEAVDIRVRIGYSFYYDDPNQLMYSNNLWEDSYGDFLYSNASVERRLRDAARIANILEQNVCPSGCIARLRRLADRPNARNLKSQSTLRFLVVMPRPKC